MNRLQQVGDKPRPKTLFERVKWSVLMMVRSLTSTVLLKSGLREISSESVCFYLRSCDPVELDFSQVEKA